MYAQKIKLLDFLGQNKKTFNIPVYQRNYDWKIDNCTRLFKDIEKIAVNNFELEHFLGTVVYVESLSRMNYTEYIIIDGQQRITSISLLLKALHSEIKDLHLKEEIYNSYIINQYGQEELRIKLKPIESDMLAYENILAEKSSSVDSNVYANYDLFRLLISESSISPENLYSALNNIEIVYIQLEKDKKSENPQMIFESLNSTGLDLTQADLIRNFLLMNHSYDQQTKLYKEYWLEIEKLLTNSKISDFVRDYLTMKTFKISTKGKVYETFKEFATDPKNNYDEQGLLEELLFFAKYYSAFLYFNSKNTEINGCLQEFQILQSTTVYPVLLYIFDDCYAYKKVSEEDLIGFMKILISYIYRRLVCGYPTNALNKIFATLINDIEESKELIYCDKLLSILSKKTSSGTFPKNKEFEIEFMKKDLYNHKINKYTLCTLENYSSKEKVNITTDITIEHIMPQTLTPHWQIELGAKYEEIHQQYLHTVGNLTITAYNSQLSNNSFSDKLEIFSSSNISISRNITQYKHWNDDVIKKRGKELFEIALKIWSLSEKYDKSIENVNVIDYSNLYSILSNINITGEKPKQLILMDTEYSIASWKDLLRTLCKELFSLDSTILYNLVRHKDFTGRERYIIDNSLLGMKSPYKIGNDIFIETNLSAIDILNYCKIIATHYQLQDDIYFLLNRNK